MNEMNFATVVFV